MADKLKAIFISRVPGTEDDNEVVDYLLSPRLKREDNKEGVYLSTGRGLPIGVLADLLPAFRQGYECIFAKEDGLHKAVSNHTRASLEYAMRVHLPKKTQQMLLSA